MDLMPLPFGEMPSATDAAVRAPGLEWAHPLVREWFVSKFGTPTEPQEQGWPHILAGRTTLISAPTGSGKTLAAFLACIDRLVRKALRGELRDRTEVLYVSPLKALGNDIQKNLEVPLGEIVQLAGNKGILMPEIRTAVRTGDTLMHERQAMIKRPPHILVTTPESLYIYLTAERSRATLHEVQTVIVDEIHNLAGSKRGSHLAISLERLDALCATQPTRIGLSATQKPLEMIAHFLTGNRPDPVVVNVGHERQMDLAIEVPASELGAVATNEMWDEMYDRIVELVRAHRSTLLFVNTRKMAERMALNLGERLGEENVATHHGSLSRKLRLQAERKLKSGEVPVLVATASLELGIDIGFVDLVIQISSPRAIAVALQRFGRAGHWRGAIPKARLFATTRDELLECAALIRAIHHGELDRILMPECPLDILAQQIVAEVASRTPRAPKVAPPVDEAALIEAQDSGVSEDELFALVRRAYPYATLTRAEFDAVIEMLSEGIAAKRGRYGAYLHHDKVHHRLRARRGARLAAITSGGAIPENNLYAMVSLPEGTVVGTLDEDFAVESNKGDIILLGNTSWRIHRVEASSGKVLVEDAHGAPPTVPFWRGEAPARTAELSEQVAQSRREISDRLPRTSVLEVRQVNKSPELQGCIDWLQSECALDEQGAEQAVDHVLAGRAVLGDVPTQKTIIAERFFDEGGGMQLVVHAPFGGRINKAWGLALRKRFCRSFNFELQAAATDDGLNIALAEQHSFPLGDVFHYLQPETVQEVLEQAVLTGSPIFATRWRWDVMRALALLRFRGGKKVPPAIQRIKSDDLLASVFPDVAACFENIEGEIKIPDHPLVREVMKDVLHEAMDIDGLRQVIRGIEDGSIQTRAVDTPVPSVFSHEILNANPYAYLDDAPLEERRSRAVNMRRVLPDSVLEEIGKLDRAAIAQVREEAWPDVRDADELHDALQTLVLVPERDQWRRYFDQLASAGRAGVLCITSNSPLVKGREGHGFSRAESEANNERALAPEGRRFWVSAECAATATVLHPNATWLVRPGEVPNSKIPERSEAVFSAVNGWMQHIGPTTASALAEMLALPANEVEQALLRLEASGLILRGRYEALTEEIEWCERRLLARIHRMTVATLRKEVEPVTPAQYMNWLLRWQHVAPGTQLHGERGMLDALRQLQGFEIPANAWERQVLARRMSDYDPKALDQLCLTGAVGWGRLSPHPATVEASSGNGRRRVIPTSVAPITFFIRDDADWMQPKHESEDELRGLSEGAHLVLDFLRQRGASFFADIVRGTQKLKSEVETALWEVVAAGLVTADGFDNLRSLIDPKRRAGQGRGSTSRPRHSAGRWTLLYVDVAERQKQLDATCWMLLRRYGVVFREGLARESNLPKWRELLLNFRRMEDRGEIRGGRFVSGFIGEQFALPIAVESLRAARKAAADDQLITVSAADPLNLIGIIVPGERVPAISGKHVAFKNGVAVEPETRWELMRIAEAGD
jgi:ATP-dependent Lhr-like helicase